MKVFLGLLGVVGVINLVVIGRICLETFLGKYEGHMKKISRSEERV